MRQAAPMQLSPAQRDVLTELGNIGISRAARQLSVLLAEPVRIAVPEVELVTSEDAIRQLALAGGDITCVYQRMSGDLAGRVALLLPAQDGLSIFQGLLDAHAPLQGLDLRAYEHEALTEIGNILISSCVSAMADMLGLRIDVSIPRFTEASATDLFNEECPHHAGQPALVIHAHLTADAREVDGRILLLLSSTAADKIMRAVQALILTAD